MQDKSANNDTASSAKLKSVVITDNGESKKRLIIAVASLVVLAAISIWVYAAARPQSENDTPPASSQLTAPQTEDFPKPDKTNPTDINTAESQAGILALGLEVYRSGANTDGKQLTSHSHYPSAMDIKNTEWVKANLKVPSSVINLLEAEILVYLPKGCDADKPSSSENKCTSFVIQSNGQDVAKSKN